jgi:hypothetical protein
VGHIFEHQLLVLLGQGRTFTFAYRKLIFPDMFNSTIIENEVGWQGKSTTWRRRRPPPPVGEAFSNESPWRTGLNPGLND